MEEESQQPVTPQAQVQEKEEIESPLPGQWVRPKSGSKTEEIDFKKAPPSKEAKELGKPVAKVTEPLTPAEKQRIKFKTKVNGLEEDVELTEDEIKRDYQLWKAGRSQFTEAQHLNQRNEAIARELSDPRTMIAAIQAAGHDVRALAENYLADQLRYEMLSPEQKRIHELEQKLLTNEATKKEEAELKARQEEQQQTNQLAGSIQKDILASLEAGEIPNTPKAVAMMARHLKMHWERKIDVSPRDVVDLVNKELRDEAADIFRRYPIGKLKEIIGPEAVKALLKDSLNDVPNPVKRQPPKDRGTNVFSAPPRKRSFINDSQFRNYMDKVRAGKA